MKAFIVILLMLVWVNVSADEAKPVSDELPQVATLNLSEMKRPVRTLVGSVISPGQQFVSSEISGVIVSTRLEMGTRVRAGDILIALNEDEQVAAVDLARANIEVAEIERDQADLAYERASTSFASKMVSESVHDNTLLELRKARARLDRAESELRQAALRLKKFQIRSPIDGFLITATPLPGEYVRPGDRLVEIVDLASRRLQLTLTPAEIDGLASGDLSVQLLLGDRHQPLDFLAIAPIANLATGMTQAELALPLSAAGVQTGQLVKLQIQEGLHRSIPRDAVRHDAEGDHVLVVIDGRLQRKSLASIKGGEAVVVMSPADVKAGDQVTAISLGGSS